MRWFALCICPFLAATSQARGAPFTIDDWSLSTGIVAPFPDGDGSNFNTLMNPFQDSHSGTVRLSSAITSFDFAWDDSSGRFLIDFAHQLQQGDASISFSSGGISITPTVDLEISIQAEYDYHLPASSILTEIRFAVVDIDPEGLGTLFSRSDAEATTIASQATGTLTLDESFIMPAGRTWLMGFGAEIENLSGSTGLIATGSGFMDIQITPIPEPATASLLLVGGCWLFRRRRRSSANKSLRESR